MGRKITYLFLLALGVVVYLGFKFYGSNVKEMGEIRQADLSRQEELITGEKKEMKLVSSAFENGGKIPSNYTCDGGDVNPRLEIKNVPYSAKSLVLILDDQDSVTGTWDHWLIWNIPPRTRSIGVDSISRGAVIGVNDFDEVNYRGPCPPSGEHRYIFRLYALGKELNLSTGASRSQVEKAMEDHILEKTGLMGRYSK